MNLFNTLWKLHASIWYTRTCCKWRMAYTLFAKQITLKIKAALTGVTMTTVRAVLSDIQQKSKFPMGKNLKVNCNLFRDANEKVSVANCFELLILSHEWFEYILYLSEQKLSN